jgi:Na+-transporting methylmalonyl-CoA/oxaloacetate decarboxylase gamma subunit
MKNSEVFKASDDMQTIGMSFFYVLVFLGLLAVIIGILGAVTAKCQSKCCSYCVSKKIKNFAFMVKMAKL